MTEKFVFQRLTADGNKKVLVKTGDISRVSRCSVVIVVCNSFHDTMKKATLFTVKMVFLNVTLFKYFLWSHRLSLINFFGTAYKFYNTFVRHLQPVCSFTLSWYGKSVIWKIQEKVTNLYAEFVSEQRAVHDILVS